MLEQIADNIWSVPAPLRIFGVIALNTRMTIVCFANNELWLHSPIPISNELKKEIDTLGTVTYLVAPSCLHHMFVGGWKEAYPNAKIYAARGLQKKRPDLNIETIFREPTEQHWEEIEQYTIEGMPIVNEVLFFHKPSQTLIVTDFVFYMPNVSGFTAFYAYINGFYSKITSPIIFKLAIKQKEDFRKSLVRVRHWQPKHISMCHHFIYSETDASTKFQAILDGFQVEKQPEESLLH